MNIKVCRRISFQPRRVAPFRVVRPRAMSHELSQTLIEQSYYIGKATIIFVGFYTSLNWLYYFTLRKRMEEEEKDKK